MPETITKPVDWTVLITGLQVTDKPLEFAAKHARSVRTLISGAVKEDKPKQVYSSKVVDEILYVTRLI